MTRYARSADNEAKAAKVLTRAAELGSRCWRHGTACGIGSCASGVTPRASWRTDGSWLAASLKAMQNANQGSSTGG